MAATLGGSAALAWACGLAPEIPVTALVSMFLAMASQGGSLRTDIRILLGLGLVVIGIAFVVALTPVEQTAWSGAFIVAIVFLAQLLPALGTRYLSVAQGLSMATLFLFGYHVGNGLGGAPVVEAAAIAMVMPLLLRLIRALPDPEAFSRQALAQVLTARDSTSRLAGVRAWLTDRPRAWSHEALQHAVQYQQRMTLLARSTDPQVQVFVAQARAAEAGLAARILAPRPSPLAPLPDLPLPPPHLQPVVDALLAIDRCERHRDDRTPEVVIRDWQRPLRVMLRGVLSRDSLQMRHALRAAGVVGCGAIAAAILPPTPLLTSFLIASFTIVQPLRSQTRLRVQQRVISTLIGATAALLLLPLLGAHGVSMVAMLALPLAIGWLLTQPILFQAVMILLVSGIGPAKAHLDAGTYLLEYSVVVLAAMVLGYGLSYLFVPRVGVEALRRQVTAAVGASSAWVARARIIALQVGPDANTQTTDRGRNIPYGPDDAGILTPIAMSLTGIPERVTAFRLQQNIRTLSEVHGQGASEALAHADRTARALAGVNIGTSLMLQSMRPSQFGAVAALLLDVHDTLVAGQRYVVHAAAPGPDALDGHQRLVADILLEQARSAGRRR